MTLDLAWQFVERFLDSLSGAASARSPAQPSSPSTAQPASSALFTGQPAKLQPQTPTMQAARVTPTFKADAATGKRVKVVRHYGFFIGDDFAKHADFRYMDDPFASTAKRVADKGKFLKGPGVWRMGMGSDESAYKAVLNVYNHAAARTTSSISNGPKDFMDCIHAPTDLYAVKGNNERPVAVGDALREGESLKWNPLRFSELDFWFTPGFNYSVIDRLALSSFSWEENTRFFRTHFSRCWARLHYVDRGNGQIDLYFYVELGYFKTYDEFYNAPGASEVVGVVGDIKDLFS
jgi:hypothetical protein